MKENERRVQGVKEQRWVHIRAKEENVKWLRKCFIGRVVEVEMVQVVKESFIMKGFKFIIVGHLEGTLCYCLEIRNVCF